MSKKTNHNTIYFLTTLSVYLGLVLVGASPQVLAQAKLAESSPSQSFEITRTTNNVFSELKLKSNLKYQDVLPFTFLGSSKFENRIWETQVPVHTSIDLYSEVVSANNQVFTVPILPRASI